MVLKVKLTKINLSSKETKEIVDYVSEEKPFHILINKTHWATVLCSPYNLKQLAIGHLLSEGLLQSVSEVKDFKLNKNQDTCVVKIKDYVTINDRISLSRLHQRIIFAACGSGSPHQYVGKSPRVESSLSVSAKIISESVNQLNFKAEQFRQTGGVHVAAIYTGAGKLVSVAEDVGRHNAVDKVIGMSALNNVNFGECFLALSGRMSGDVAFKAAKVGLPIVASIATALSSGIFLALDANLTLVGFVRGKRMNVYTCPNRIIP